MAWTGEQAQQAIRIASALRAGDKESALKAAASLAWSLKSGGLVSSAADTLDTLIAEAVSNPKTIVKAIDQCHSIAREAGKLKPRE
jgi:hypothetical protein